MCVQNVINVRGHLAPDGLDFGTELHVEDACLTNRLSYQSVGSLSSIRKFILELYHCHKNVAASGPYCSADCSCLFDLVNLTTSG